MAKAIRPLGAEASAQILSVLSDLGFHQSNTTKKQLEFSGSNLPTIYIQNKGTLETPVFGNIMITTIFCRLPNCLSLKIRSITANSPVSGSAM